MARKLIDPDDGTEIEVPQSPPDLIAAARSGSRLRALQDLRDVLARSIVECDSPRDLAGLSRQLTDVLEQIEQVQKAQPEKKGSPLDELANRRSGRKPAATRRQGA